MKIQNIKLQDIHRGSKVTYVPGHVHGNAGHPDCEGGIISSWTDRFVFVNYNKGIGVATKATDLVWG